MLDGKLMKEMLKKHGIAILKDDDKVYNYEEIQPEYNLSEIGGVGTRLVGGQLAVDPNVQMRPTFARGCRSNSGMYDQLLRDPIAYASINSLTSLIRSGQFHLDYDPETPEAIVRDAQEIWSQLQSIQGGWVAFIEQLCSTISHGFSTFEVVWEDEVVTKLAFREQNTTHRWIVDADGRELDAVEYMSGGDNAKSYTLKAKGTKLEEHQVLLASVFRKGLNFEGISPLRTIKILVQYKQLILQILALQTDRFGCPILLLEPHDSLYKPDSIKVNEADMNEAFTHLRYMSAHDTPTIKVPLGMKARFLSPSGQPIQLIPILAYIDQQISQVFATQAMQLGHSGSGSYALSKTQENDLTRAAPAYAQTLLQPINALISNIMQIKYGHDNQVFPSLCWHEVVQRDDSKWLDDAFKLNQEAVNMPEEMVEKALEILGLPTDIYKVPEVTEEATTIPVAVGDDIQKSVLNGAQVTALIAVLAAVSAGELPPESAQAILETAYQLSPEEAKRMVGSGTSKEVEDNPTGV